MTGLDHLTDDPWWASGAWPFVAARLKPTHVAFEWGSGASTKCIAQHCRIISVEHDPAWHERLAAEFSGNPNITLTLCPHGGRSTKDARDVDGYASYSIPEFRGLDFTTYAHAIDAYPTAFNLIAIDGRARPSCLAHAIPRVADGGLLLVDDRQREHYAQGLALIPVHWREFRFACYGRQARKWHQTSVWVKTS